MNFLQEKARKTHSYRDKSFEGLSQRKVFITIDQSGTNPISNSYTKGIKKRGPRRRESLTTSYVN